MILHSASWAGRRFSIAVAAGAVVLAGPGGAGASEPAATVRDVLRTRVEVLREAPASLVRGDTLWLPQVVAAFLEARGFVPPWDLGGTAAEVLQAIRDIHGDGLQPADYHLEAIEATLEARRALPSPEADADLQLLLTDALAALVDHVRHGRVEPASLDHRWNVDPRFAAPPLEAILDLLAAAPSLAVAVDSFKPTHFLYTGLRRALAELRTIEAGGGWSPVPPGPALEPGVTDARVVAVRRRLAASGELPPEVPLDSPVFDAALAAAVSRFQQRHRLTPDGVVGDLTLEALNVGVRARIGQVRVGLERARWVVNGLRDTFVLVNLPAFKVFLVREGRSVWEARAQVGQRARQTPSFRADLRYLVLNPDWTVPPTILARDVLDDMRRGGDAITRKKLTIIDRQGRHVDPATIDWARARASSFPYTLRQAPGAGNALGRVKFMFPNPHAVFLHDTPSQELFRPDQRTFSSGCIRVERALELAALLLEANDGWTREKIDEAVATGRTETVFLAVPVPVLIVYLTAIAGPSGELRFARDVYGLDPALLAALDSRGPRTTRRLQ